MAYALRYQAQCFWVGPGAGPMQALNAPALPGVGGGTGQLAEFSGGASVATIPVVNGAGASGVIAASDITTLTNAMAADIAAQMNLPANLAKMQGWTTGNP